MSLVGNPGSDVGLDAGLAAIRTDKELFRSSLFFTFLRNGILLELNSDVSIRWSSSLLYTAKPLEAILLFLNTGPVNTKSVAFLAFLTNLIGLF